MTYASALLTLILATLATWIVVATALGGLWAYHRRRQLGRLQRRGSWDLSTDFGGPSR
ncbi:MAG: hypothetical protein P1V81_10335 [Planctomycetota bacterium]|nr:hypothetical protein [Planctomycetota bacterium]